MHTIRIWFSKQGEASYISHLDLQRVMGRVLRKAKLPVWYSKGYHPHIYMAFALPLPLGQESFTEIMDYHTEEEPPNLDRIYYGLKDVMPRGISIYRVSIAKQKTGEIGYARYLVRFPKEIAARVREAAKRFDALETASVWKIGKKNGKKGVRKELNLKEFITEPLTFLDMNQDLVLDITLPAGTVTINPALLLQYFAEQENIPMDMVSIVRTQILDKNKENFE